MKDTTVHTINLHDILAIADLGDDFKQKVASVAHLGFGQFATDSRNVQTGDVFILLKSQNPNAIMDVNKVLDYLNQVADKAVFVLSELELGELTSAFALPIVEIVAIRDVLGDLIGASLQAKQKIALPKIVAVTGTNGKTTISQLVAQLLSLSGQKTAVMGTAGNGVLQSGQLKLTPSTHTTLQAFEMQHAVYDNGKQGVAVLSMEASSHGLHQQRLQGLPIGVAVFSNLSRDHLDYHADMADYANAKAKLFDKALFTSLTHAIINFDDEMSEVFLNQAQASGLIVWTYSLQNANANFFAKAIHPSLAGVDLTIATPMGEIKVASPLLGRFNVANLLASVAAAMALGLNVGDIAKFVPKLRGAVGRMEQVPSKTGAFIVDYAHTPDALEQVLKSLKVHCAGDLWAVFGCGGDRDKGKRPLMTQVALQFADKVVLTADNPRTENPLAILKDMQAGMTCDDHYKTHIEPDRKQAIAYAVRHAKDNDIVVIAGKGHETYQEINGVKYDFDDKVVVAEMIDIYHNIY